MKNRTARQLLKNNKEIQRIAKLLRRVCELASDDGNEFTEVTFDILDDLKSELNSWNF